MIKTKEKSLGDLFNNQSKKDLLKCIILVSIFIISLILIILSFIPAPTVVEIKNLGSFKVSDIYNMEDYKNQMPGYKIIGFKDKNNNQVYSIKNNYQPFRFFSNNKIILEPITEIINYNIKYTNVGISDESLNSDIDLQTSYTVEDLISLPTLSCEGYTFLGYYLNEKQITEIQKGNIGNKNIEIRWEINHYTINYTQQGIKEEYVNIQGEKPLSYTMEENVDLPLLSNKGYEFLGYFNNGNQIIQIPKGSVGDINLVTKWKPIKYNITYTNSGINVVENESTIQGEKLTSYTIEDVVTLPELTNKGYTFLGYYKNDNQITTINKGSTGEINLVAKWKPISYTINYTQQGIKEEYVNIQGEKPISYTIEDTIDLSSYTLTNNGYEFLGYTLNGQSITKIEQGNVGNKTIITKWKPIKYNINYSNSGINVSKYESTIQGEKPTSYTIEDVVTLPKLTNKGYTFLGYKLDGHTIEKIEQGNTEDKTITLNWESIKYNITYKNNGINVSENELTIKGDKLTSYTIEDVVTLPKLTNKGYTFLGYTLDGHTIEKIEQGNTEDKTIILNWESIKYNITYKNNGINVPENELTIKGDKPTSYTIEDVVTLPELTNKGYTFLGYYKNDNQITTINKDSTGEINLVAKWKPISYTINYTQQGIKEEYVNIQGEKPLSYTMEENVDLPLLSNKGYEFLGYFNNGNQITQIPKGSVGDINLVTKWKPISYTINYTQQGIKEEYLNIQGEKPTSYTIEDTIDLSSYILTNTGYEFVGYYKNDTKITTIQKGSTGEINLVAKWKPINYTINYQDKYNVANSNPQSYTIEDNVNLSNLSLEKYKFVAWQNNNKPLNNIKAGTVGPLTLTASWSMVGTGTNLDPYLIYNEDQLKTLFTDMNAYYILQDNFNISYTWSPIGKIDNKFNGCFNGNGKVLTINEIETTNKNIDSFAIFGYLGSSAKVQNLTVNATPGKWADNFKCNIFAGIVLYNEGIVENCINNINITTSIDFQDNLNNFDKPIFSLSGICYENSNILYNCKNGGKLKVKGSKSAFVSGICCKNISQNSTITDCDLIPGYGLYAEASNLAYVAKYVMVMANGAKLRIKKEKWSRSCVDLSSMKAIVTSTSLGTNAEQIKEVIINKNLQSFAYKQEVGYVYYLIMTWDKEQKYNGYKFNRMECWQNVFDLNIYQVLNKNYEWENQTDKNLYGVKYLRTNNTGYNYIYLNDVQVTSKNI